MGDSWLSTKLQKIKLKTFDQTTTSMNPNLKAGKNIHAIL